MQLAVRRNEAADGFGVNAAPANVFPGRAGYREYPGNNVSTLFGLISSQSAFPTTLTAVPNDWTIGVTYTYSSFGAEVRTGHGDRQLRQRVHHRLDGQHDIAE